MNEIEITQPEVINVTCPQCSLTWLNLLDYRTYFCYACGYIIFEKQLLEKGLDKRK